eukprot:SAG31_NODE_173_length_21354_cov_16.826112_5_plen_314_part_00
MLPLSPPFCCNSCAALTLTPCRAANGLTYNNSLKMKMSVLLGVAQMVFGIILKATNDLHFKRPLDLYCEFIPQMIFMNGIFGYMCFMIIKKWSICWVPEAETLIPLNATNGATFTVYECTGKLQDADGPPDIKQLLIGMFMQWGTDAPDRQNLFTGQHYFQMPLVIICMICPLVMLFPKPLILRAEHQKSAGYSNIRGDDDEAVGSHGGGGGHGHGEEFDFAEVMIHQVIETIEFVLGAVSNTASYLRLWALSLAHSQLTDVFYEKILLAGLEAGEGMSPYVHGFIVFVAFGMNYAHLRLSLQKGFGLHLRRD